MFQTFRFMGGHFVAIRCPAHWKIVGSNGEYYGVFKSVQHFKRDGKLPRILCYTRLVTELIGEIDEKGLSNERSAEQEND